MKPPNSPGVNEHGAALVTALALVLAVLMMGISAARAALNGEKSARLERDRQIAFAAAEAALADAQRDIAGAAAVQPTRAALFDGGTTGFVHGCGRGGDDLGLCLAAGGTDPPVWQQVDLASETGVSVPFGTFTGSRMGTSLEGAMPSRLPRYIIELVPVPGATPAHGSFYRVTAIGFGTRDGTQVVLQSFYRKNTASAGTGGAPATPAVAEGRIGWREIANWPELHAEAMQ